MLMTETINQNLYTQNDDIVKHVWQYYEAGFCIIPLGKNEKNNLKAPSIKEWKQFEETRPTKKQVQAWIDEGLFVGIGIIGGAVSDNLAVIDFDDENIPNLIGLNLANLATKHFIVKTGKGYHIYCFDTKPVKTRKAAIVSMDFKADKGYVAAPPSPHESGTAYVSMSNFDTLINKTRIDAMAWFDEIVETVKKARGIKPKKWKSNTPVNTQTDTPPCIKHMLKGAEEGRRNETLFTLVCYYKNVRNFSEDETKNNLVAWNNGLEKPLTK